MLLTTQVWLPEILMLRAFHAADLAGLPRRAVGLRVGISAGFLVNDLADIVAAAVAAL